MNHGAVDHSMEDQLSWHNTHPRFVEDYADYIAMFAPVAVSVHSGRTLYFSFAYSGIIIDLSQQFDCEQFPEGTRWTFDQVPSWVWRTTCSVWSDNIVRVGDKLLRNRNGNKCAMCYYELDTHWFFCRKCRMGLCRMRHLPRYLMFTLVDGLLSDVVGLVCLRLIELTMLTDGQC